MSGGRASFPSFHKGTMRAGRSHDSKKNLSQLQRRVYINSFNKY